MIQMSHAYKYSKMKKNIKACKGICYLNSVKYWNSIRSTMNVILVWIVYLSKCMVFRDVFEPLSEHSLEKLLCDVMVVPIVVALIDFMK